MNSGFGFGVPQQVGPIGRPSPGPFGESWQGPQPGSSLASPTPPLAAPAKWIVQQPSAPGAANAAVTLTQPAPGWRRNRLVSYFIRVSGASPTSDVPFQILSGSTVIWNDIIPAGTAIGQFISYPFTVPLDGYLGQPMTITVAAGGAGVQWTVNMQGDSV